ncbi:MAG: hypothetical protein IJH67_09730 [Thermoguttaceae bacterium]|nr:hypothetical protein [Thermoguttaceae bacterium]
MAQKNQSNRGVFCFAGQDVLEPAERMVCAAKKIFGCFHFFLDGCAVKQDSEGGVHPGGDSGFVDLLNTIPTFCSPFRRTA